MTLGIVGTQPLGTSGDLDQESTARQFEVLLVDEGVIAGHRRRFAVRRQCLPARNPVRLVEVVKQLGTQPDLARRAVCRVEDLGQIQRHQQQSAHGLAARAPRLGNLGTAIDRRHEIHQMAALPRPDQRLCQRDRRRPVAVDGHRDRGKVLGRRKKIETEQ